jgi:2,4-dienoyl-CoA reductase-like NADH-dependent reductase (Old Yellow Enzyme family)
MHVFKHPKYYTELRKRNRVARNPMGGYSQSDQAISKELATAGNQRSPGPGLKQQASSAKPQASSPKLTKHQATSVKP